MKWLLHEQLMLPSSGFKNEEKNGEKGSNEISTSKLSRRAAAVSGPEVNVK